MPRRKLGKRGCGVAPKGKSALSWGSDMEAQTECRPSVEMPTCVLVVQREDDVRHDMDPNVDMQCYIT